MEEEIINLPLDPVFDLYTHLKANLKNNTNLCEFHESELVAYCLKCKCSLCEVCRDSLHSTHSHYNKDGINFDTKRIDSVFTELEELIINTEIISSTDKIKKNYIDIIIREYQEMVEKLDELKLRRIKEIEKIFQNKTNHKKLLEYISAAKKSFYTYFGKYTAFFTNNKPKNVWMKQDFNSFIFLHLYNFINETTLANNDYIDALNIIKRNYEYFLSKTENKFLSIKRVIEKSLEEQKKNEIISTNLLVLESHTLENDTIELANPGKSGKSANPDSSKETNDSNIIKGHFGKCNVFERLNEDLYTDVKEKIDKMTEHIEEFKKEVFDSFKQNGTLIEIDKLVKMYEEKANKRGHNNQAQLKLSFSQAKSNILDKPKTKLKDNEKSSKETSKEKVHSKTPNKILLHGNDNLIKEEDEGDSLFISDKNVIRFVTNETGSNNLLDDDNDDKFEVNIKTNTMKKNKNMVNDTVYQKLNNMFKPKPKVNKCDVKPPSVAKKATNINLDEIQKINQTKVLETVKENQKLQSQLKYKDDIHLDISSLRKYFTFSTLEFVRKTYYKMNLGYSSHFLFTNKTEIHEENTLTIKIIESSNEIHIYDKKTRKIEKKTIEFDKKKFGVTVFPRGSRSVLNQDSYYITGGRDIHGEKKYFWVYSLKENRLSKLPEMSNARSYHTVVFHENLKALLVFGGENNSSCELYDFYLNMWNPLPELTVPRANISIFIDKLGTFAYAICGILGSISNCGYSDCIELLDLVEMSQGWAKIDYTNKSNVDLKQNENKIFPLTEDKILIYGGNENRDVVKCHVIFDLKTFNVEKINESTLGELKLKSVINQDI